MSNDELEKKAGVLHKNGWSLMELLCVIAIISILGALYLGAISRAFAHVKKVLGF